MLLMTARAQNRTPATRSGVAFAGTIGVNNNMGEGFGVRHTVNLLCLGCLLNSADFQQPDLIGRLLEYVSPEPAQLSACLAGV